MEKTVKHYLQLRSKKVGEHDIIFYVIANMFSLKNHLHL